MSSKIIEFAMNAANSQKGLKAWRPARVIAEDDRKLPTTSPAVSAAKTTDV
jgi:hypothetical protein